MPRAIDKDLLDCLRRPNPYVEYRVEISTPDVGQVLKRSDQFTAPVSMTPAGSLTASPRGPLGLTPTTTALANFAAAGSSYGLNGEAETRRVKGLAWKLDGAFNRATLKSIQARIQRVAIAGFFFPADFELQVFRILKTPGVKQSNVGTPQYQSTVWTEYDFVPLLNPAPVIKYGSVAWDGSNNATLTFDVANWGLVLDNSLVRAVSPDQTGELPEYLIVVRLTGKVPAGTGHYWWYSDTVSSRTIANVGTFERVWWARENDQQQWVRNAFADVPSVTVNVEAYPATGSAIYLLDLGAVPKAVSEGRAVFERAVPPGTTATFEISTAGSGGPWTPAKHGDPVAIKQQTYHVRVTENADAALKATPLVNAMGVEFRTPRDVSLESVLQLPTREVSMPWGTASIPEGKVRVVRTGKRDYLDVATVLGSSSPTSRLEADIYMASRHPSITRDKWLRLERMMVTNRTPSATSEEFTLLSYASRLKRKIPAKIESLNSVHIVQAGSTASQLIVLPVLPGTTGGGNEYDGKNYYMRVRTTAAPNTAVGYVQTIQGNTSTDRLDFTPALSEALVTGDVIEVHSGIFNTQAVSWTDYDPADVWWEVLTTHLAIPPERIGAGYLPRGGKPPKVTDRAPGDATTQAKLKVTGRLTEQESGDEILDQLSAIMGGVTMEVDGQIVFIQLLPLRNVAGEVTVPLPPSVATFDARDMVSLQTPPGLEKRSTILSSNYGVPATASNPDAFPSRTTTATDSDALLWLAQQDMEDLGTAEVAKEITRWFYNSTDSGLYLASVFNAQIVKATSTGLRVFPAVLAEKHPELLPGDVVVIHTSQYTDYDPSTGTSLKGPLAIRGVIVKLGGEGRQLGLFIPGLGENVTQVVGGAAGTLPGLGPVPAPPILFGYFDALGELFISSSAGDANTASHKIAWSTVAPPSEATVRAQVAIDEQSVSGLATGLVVTGLVYIAAFAYSANGVESALSELPLMRNTPDIDALRHPKRSWPFDDGKFAPRAADTSGWQVDQNVTDYGSRVLQRFLAKPLVADPDDSDPIPAGVLKRIPKVGGMDGSGNLDLGGTAWVNRQLDNVADGTTYGRPLLGRLSAGKPFIDFSESFNLNKHGANIGRSAGDATAISTIVGHLANTGHAAATMQESGTKPINRLYAKVLAADADNLDSVGNGTTYSRPLATRINAGKPVIDFTEAIHTGKTLDNIPNTATRFAAVEAGADKTSTKTSADTAAVSGTAAATVQSGAARGQGGFTNSTGGLVSTATESGTKPVNRLLAKLLAADPDNLSGVPDSLSRFAAVEAGANKTETRTAAAITGQGALATAASADFATQVTGATKPANNATVGATWGTNVTSQPTTLAGINATEGNKLTGIAAGADVTSANTAAAIASQGALATASLVTPSLSTSRSRISLYTTSNQVINNATPTDISWGAIYYEIGGGLASSGGGLASQVRVLAGATTGALLWTCSAAFASNSTGYRALTLNREGVVMAASRVAAVNGDETILTLTWIETAAVANDDYTLNVYQNSGGNLNLTFGHLKTRISAINLW